MQRQMQKLQAKASDEARPAELVQQQQGHFHTAANLPEIFTRDLEKMARAELARSRIKPSSSSSSSSSEVVSSVSLSLLSNSISHSHSYIVQGSSAQAPFIIFHPISSAPQGHIPEPLSEIPRTLIDTKTQKLKVATYNIRGLRRFGRQVEVLHLLTEHRFDFIGIQETKSSGNTLTQLASGFFEIIRTRPFIIMKKQRVPV